MQKASLQSECSHDQVRGHQTACETRLTVGEGETPVPHRKAHICRATPVPCDAIRNPASHAHRVSRQTAGERAEQSKVEQIRAGQCCIVMTCRRLMQSLMGWQSPGHSAPLKPLPLLRSGQWPIAAHPPPLSQLPMATTFPTGPSDPPWSVQTPGFVARALPVQDALHFVLLVQAGCFSRKILSSVE